MKLMVLFDNIEANLLSIWEFKFKTKHRRQYLLLSLHTSLEIVKQETQIVRWVTYLPILPRYLSGYLKKKGKITCICMKIVVIIL